jgi:hypothetical protein
MAPLDLTKAACFGLLKCAAWCTSCVGLRTDMTAASKCLLMNSVPNPIRRPKRRASFPMSGKSRATTGVTKAKAPVRKEGLMEGEHIGKHPQRL